jgi:outer membrane protein TolC
MLEQLSVFFTIAAIVAIAPSAAGAQQMPVTPPSLQSGTLDSIARLAITRNLALRRATERAHEADAGVRQAQGLFLPSLAVDTRYTAGDGVVNIGDFINPAYAALNQLIGRNDFPTNINATLPLRQETKLRSVLPLFNGAIFANLGGARAIQSLRGAERAAAVRRLDAEARLAWLDWARAARAVQIWDATLPVLSENARVSQRLVDAGSATPDAVLRARAALADAEQQRGEAVRVREAARGALNLLLDQPDETQLILDPRGPAADASDAPVISLDDALKSSARREERRIATAAVDGARAQGQAATSAFVPSVALAADYGVQGNTYVFDKSHAVTTASLVVQLNLFSGGQDAARRESANAARRGAALQAAEVDRQVTLDVRTAWDAVQVARQAVTAADARLAAARAEFTLVDRRYGEGLVGHLEWSDARAQFTAAQLNQSLTHYLLSARGVELERAAALRPLPNN